MLSLRRFAFAQLLLLIVLYPTFFSCKYTPTGYTFVEVDSTVVAYLDINLHEYDNESPVVIWGYVNFEFDIENDNREIFDLKVFFNDSLLELRYPDRFSINTQNYPDGIHPLKIVVAVKSETGSLADNLDAEAIVFQREWQVNIINAPPEPVQITSMRPHEGRLVIEWEKYTRPDFLYYLVLRQYKNFNLDTIRTQDITTIIDSVYVGGEIQASVDVVLTGNRQVYGPQFQYYHDQTKFTDFTISENYKISLHWTKCPFSAIFKKYLLKENYDEQIEIGNVADTTYIEENTQIGRSTLYELWVNDEGIYKYTSQISAFPGGRIPPFTSVNYTHGNSSFYLYNNPRFSGDIFRMDAINFDTLSIQATYKYAFDISPDGQYAYGADYWNLFKVNPTSLSQQAIYWTSNFLKDLYGQGQDIIRSLYVSNQNHVIYLGELTLRNSTVYHISILDLNS